MQEMYMTNAQARAFLLYKHGLLDKHRFTGKEGVMAFIRQAGCIQFDPIDVCGRNPDLVLRARVKGYQKRMLEELLYKDRALVDYFDKNLAIIPSEDWKYFARYRAGHEAWERSREEIKPVCEAVKAAIMERGPLCSADLDMNEKVQWYWSSTRLSRAALEHLYFTGELGIHHKKGTVKYYDLIERCLPARALSEPDPYTDEAAHLKWRVYRRIGAVGLLWNRPSDAWLNIEGLKSAQREQAFSALLQEGSITKVTVEGINCPMYLQTADVPLAEFILQEPKLMPRCECIAPLDNMLWDRKLISALFGFDYKWEIYTPVVQRKFGYYVLPLLYGTRFIGRIEAVCNRQEKRLEVKHIWLEPGVKQSAYLEKAINGCIRRLAAFNGVQAPAAGAFTFL
ncbi:MAG: crosslink repair DNA glycosylase YcaQ family protein [Eubacteriales bacterium]|nr:crosslink repair DNA glycosylase YcaQ family protein [Eubacteriales bacterium]